MEKKIIMSDANQSINQEQVKLCKRCHRKLKDEKSILLGYGATCYKKIKKHPETYLFKIEEDK